MDLQALSRLSRLLIVLGTISLTTSALNADPEFPKTPGAFTATTTSLRSQPSETAPKVAALPQGVRGDVVGHKGGWVKLRMPSGKTGWAPADRLALNEPARLLIRQGAPAPRTVTTSIRVVATVVDDSATLPTAEPPVEDIPETGGTPISVDNLSIPRSESQGDRMVRKGLTYRGWRYRWGATGNGAFDCSGLTQFLYAKEGKYIPRTAREQYSAGQVVAKEDMQPGDLVFFRNTSRRGISHVGMYIGGNQFLHAAGRRKGVRVDDITKKYYQAHWAGARRF